MSVGLTHEGDIFVAKLSPPEMFHSDDGRPGVNIIFLVKLAAEWTRLNVGDVGKFCCFHYFNLPSCSRTT